MNAFNSAFPQQKSFVWFFLGGGGEGFLDARFLFSPGRLFL